MVSTRGLDLLAAFLLTPLHLLLRLTGPRPRQHPRLGRANRPFPERLWEWQDEQRNRQMQRWGMHRLGGLANLWRGEVSLVGPRARALDEVDAPAWVLQSRPGWITPAATLARMGLDYGGEWEAPLRPGWLAYLSLLTRSAALALLASPATPGPDRVDLQGIPVDRLRIQEAVDRIEALARGPRPAQVSFLNAHCVNVACRDPDYRQALRDSQLVLPDGIGIRLAGLRLGAPIRHNLNGTDLFPRLCQQLEGSGLGVFLLGAAPGVAEAVRAWATERYPGLAVVGTRHGFFEEGETDSVLAEIRRSQARVLIVALGVPRQELWIARHLHRLEGGVVLGVGGLFDFLSGRIPRAPLGFRQLGCEWVWRLGCEPRRMWRRYLVGNVVFMLRVERERLAKRMNQE